MAAASSARPHDGRGQPTGQWLAASVQVSVRAMVEDELAVNRSLYPGIDLPVMPGNAGSRMFLAPRI